MITVKYEKERLPKKVNSEEIPIGTIFTGSVGRSSGLYMMIEAARGERSIRPLDCRPENFGKFGPSWTGSGILVDDYRPVDIEITVK